VSLTGLKHPPPFSVTRGALIKDFEIHEVEIQFKSHPKATILPKL
jgi:hypothetical protein